MPFGLDFLRHAFDIRFGQIRPTLAQIGTQRQCASLIIAEQLFVFLRRIDRRPAPLDVNLAVNAVEIQDVGEHVVDRFAGESPLVVHTRLGRILLGNDLRGSDVRFLPQVRGDIAGRKPDL